MIRKTLILLALPLQLFSQELDSAHVSKVVMLINDYKACVEINDSLTNRNRILKDAYASAQLVIVQADSTFDNCVHTVQGLNERVVELGEKNAKLKKRRKWWYIGGLATGLSAFLLLFF